MRAIRRGKEKLTASGPMYQHHNVWINDYTQHFVKEYAEKYGLDENHVIGIIVDEYFAKQSCINDRLDYTNRLLTQRHNDEDSSLPGDFR